MEQTSPLRVNVHMIRTRYDFEAVLILPNDDDYLKENNISFSEFYNGVLKLLYDSEGFCNDTIQVSVEGDPGTHYALRVKFIGEGLILAKLKGYI